jgi:macrolide transport system ATP-binding/permease protein
MVLGVGHEYAKIANSRFQSGGNFSSHNVDARSAVCVVGDAVKGELSPQREMLNQVITLSQGEQVSFPCRVVGVLEPQKSAIEWFQPDRQVYVPYTYLQAYTTWSREVNSFTVTLRSGSDVETTGKRIQGFFDAKYEGSADFRVDGNSTLVAQMKRFLNIFSLLLASIAVLTLIVGGIGIQNMMLVSIADRLKEFGLRKALGATNRSLKVQVLSEGIMLCGISGAVGLALGVVMCIGLLYGATQMIPDLKFELILDPVAILSSCLAIIVVGIVSGIVPALKAEKISIIDALRSE